MARKKPAKKAKKKAAAKPAAKKAAKKSMKKATKPAARTARKAKKTAKPAKKAAPVKRATAKKSPAKAAPKKAAAPASAKASAGRPMAKAPASKPVAKAAAGRSAKKANIDRPRKTVADIRGIPSSLDLNRNASAVRSGRAEMNDRLAKNTSASPALTSGDVDADWQSADAVGDEAPGGDNPTPDQDVVDDIGRALGVEYEDDEELQGGDEIADRDRHRWELDPSSKDDFDDEE